MKLGIIGGLFFGGLLTGALIGLLPGAILLGLGAVASCITAAQEQYAERQAERQAESWRRDYPSYKY